MGKFVKISGGFIMSRPRRQASKVVDYASYFDNSDDSEGNPKDPSEEEVDADALSGDDFEPSPPPQRKASKAGGKKKGKKREGEEEEEERELEEQQQHPDEEEEKEE